ncbi:MAG: OmpH family outer membrane protein [Thermoanaerobaculales bacterium]|nr:OmpH family outer membrane protein [Thermoanaerobaculales bacterium]
MYREILKTVLFGLVAMVVAVSASAQAQIAVIDIQRVVTESDAGKESLGKLKRLQDAKIAEGRQIQEDMDGLRDQISKQRFTLSQEKLEELNKQFEDKGIALQRFQDDAQRELEEARRKALGGLEERILPIIDQVGKDQGMTLIFNKFQSGLVYADDSVDITEEVIRRFNTVQ